MGARWGIVAVARHRRLRSALLSGLDELVDVTSTTPPAVRILQEVAPRSLVPSILLACYRLRYAELARFDLPAYASGRPQRLQRVKGSASLHIQPIHDPTSPEWRRVDPQTPVVLVSYDSLAHDLAYARDRAGIHLAGDHFDRTHIFRHLHASWLHSAGVPVGIIARALGHHSPASTASYIHHDELTLPPVTTCKE